MAKSKAVEPNGSAMTIDSIGNLPVTSQSKEVLTRGNHKAPAKSVHGPQVDHPTTYAETLMHLLRGNIGSGLFAMGDAFRNGGLILGAILTLFLGIVCVHNQHVLLKCSRRVKEKKQLLEDPDFAETVEYCFELGSPCMRRLSRTMKIVVNSFICTTQIGFCCVYFVFASSTLSQVFKYYEVNMHPFMPMVIVLFPILLPSLIMNLKYLAPFSMFANVCMAIGVSVVFYYAFQDVSKIEERRYIGDLEGIPLYFGTAMFAFEGIALVLPLKNAMRKPDSFDRPMGVLNVGICFATILYISFGFFGYLRWGDEVEGSLTLNLPKDVIVAQVVKVAVGFGMCLTFALQFFIPIQIMLPHVQNKLSSCCNATVVELSFRIMMVGLAFTIASLVPHLNVMVSLIGALCATALALFFPVLCQLVLVYGDDEKRPSWFMLCKNGFIMLFALFGLLTGTYESIGELIRVSSAGNES